MTNEEKKAREIYDRFNSVVYYKKLSRKNENSKCLPISMHNEQAKQCALICVEEIILVCPYISKEDAETLEQIRANENQFMSFWQKVKQIIEQL